MGPSLAVEGATTSRVFTSRVFETYVKRLLAPALKPGQVVVMDNLGAHRPKKIRELIEGRGCQLFYLPSYSPDLNPIEEALSISPLEDQVHPQENLRSHQGGPNRGDRSSVGGREC
jgi:hypothetical protein